MEGSESFVYENQEDESKDFGRFGQSLQELKDLRFQLYRAADLCEKSFLNAKHKQVIVENTKAYVCRAIVTVIDHLGSVTANIEDTISKTDTISQVQLRVDSLKQKIGMCEEYSRKQALRKVCWNVKLQRYHPRYIAPPTPNVETSNNEAQRNLISSRVGAKSMNKNEFEREEDVPLFIYTYNYKPSQTSQGQNSNFKATVLPVCSGVSSLPKSEIQSFHFQQETRKLRRRVLNWKSLQNKDFISSLGRSKRMT